jgi:DNA-binding GntR family transcriptional regulator
MGTTRKHHGDRARGRANGGALGRDPSSGDNLVPPIESPRTKKSYVSDWLREQIISGEMAPGERLRQLDVAKKLGVSMTPVREGMSQLEAEGYLVRVSHVGVSVAELPRDRLEEVFPLRMRLEGFLAARTAENATEEDFAELRELSDRFARAVDTGEIATQRILNYRFHRRLWESARQPLGLDLVNRLWASFPADLFIHQSERAARSAAEHDEILTALEARDPVAAEAAVVAHIQSGFNDQQWFRSLAESVSE